MTQSPALHGLRPAAAARGPVVENQPEELMWDEPVALHAESRAIDEGGGFALRLHADPECAHRLTDGSLFGRRYEAIRADSLCLPCAGHLVASSLSSYTAHLRDRLGVLHRIRAEAALGPLPREIVHARAIRFEAEMMRSVHPDLPALQAEVAMQATEVMEALRESLLLWDASRRSH